MSQGLSLMQQQIEYLPMCCKGYLLLFLGEKIIILRNSLQFHKHETWQPKGYVEDKQKLSRGQLNVLEK